MSRQPTKLWGGRFRKKTNPSVERFSHSLPIDRRLAACDLAGSIAHAQMLGTTRIIPKKDAGRLVSALKTMLKAEEAGRLKLNPKAEDVHTAIQEALEKRVGQAAGRLHTARSRNDQVVTSLRLYCKEALCCLTGRVEELQRSILKHAKKNGTLSLPGYTHLRHAQPIGVAHVMLSYLEMLERDVERLTQTTERFNRLPLGSGALAGSSLPIDRNFVAKKLGFGGVCQNSLDAVTDRDFVVEILSDLSLLAVHLSRIAEDLLLWSTAEFGFLKFDESMLTGSSMMPQKQNPDFLELVRGSSAQITGNLAAILNLVKGLSSGYQRDLQLDKEILFEALDRMCGMLEVTTQGFGAMAWDRDALNQQLADESLYATDLAEFLVSQGVTFSQAHQAVGRLLSHAAQRGVSLHQLPLATWRKFAPEFDESNLYQLNAAVSILKKCSLGSTNPRKVAVQINRWTRHLSRR